MKQLLSLAFACMLAAGSASAQTSGAGGGPLELDPRGLTRGDVGSRNSNPPVTNPEPITLVALAGGAAVAGGLLRRRKKAA